MDVKYVNVRNNHNGSIQTIAINPGISTDELESVLQAVFGARNVVGFQAQV